MTDNLYTGQRQEIEIGLDYYVARFYDPVLAHFAQADSIVPEPGSVQGFDRYAYVMNNPVNFNDPSGHFFCEKSRETGQCLTPTQRTEQEGTVFNNSSPVDDYRTTFQSATTNVVYVSGYSEKDFVAAHQYQGDGTSFCGAYSIAMVATLKTGDDVSGADVFSYLELKGYQKINGPLSQRNLTIAAGVFIPNVDIASEKNGNLDDLKANINSGKLTIAGISWETNSQIIEKYFSGQRNDIVGGHWVVVVGYNDTTSQIILLDPGIKSNPFTIYSYDEFTKYWKEQPNAYVGHGNMVTFGGK